MDQATPPGWDPFDAMDIRRPAAACVRRVHQELKRLHKDPLPGISCCEDVLRADTVHAVVVGPSGTPYEAGFFYFLLWFPADFPLVPPKVRLMNTDGGQVRFNPNLYANGKVCLSILGTWDGPAWVPTLGLRGVLLSVQSLLGERPWENEPCIGRAAPEIIQAYNDSLRHETVRIAVLGMLDTAWEHCPAVPWELRQKMIGEVESRWPFLDRLCAERVLKDGYALSALGGAPERRRFRWKQLRRELRELAAHLGHQPPQQEEELEQEQEQGREQKPSSRQLLWCGVAALCAALLGYVTRRYNPLWGRLVVQSGVPRIAR
eukprot:TRINITY_DN11051_c0_g1_i1.p2 TRINITY_DN11051_c0_g1~~TRINITY_DN11051_c0_g1_i1.p2  ORF type:complete len:350 (+),score=135.03 TRINITY_DN11051_c0_g1_i1:96-1052(+)